MDLHQNISPSIQLFPFIELEDGRTLGVKIRQAGRSEVLLETLTPLHEGLTAILRIDDEKGECWYRSTAEVHWTHSIPGGLSVGMYLNNPLTEELLSWWEWDRRELIRYALDVPARIWWHGSRCSHSARVTNYSSSGLGMICQDQVTLGRRAIICAGTHLDDILCVIGVPTWQVRTEMGVRAGFELEENEGKRFGGHSLKRLLFESPNSPIESESTHPFEMTRVTLRGEKAAKAMPAEHKPHTTLRGRGLVHKTLMRDNARQTLSTDSTDLCASLHEWAAGVTLP